ncbi:hypothetical protein WG908_03400 [Sphingobium sp. AN641]
MTFDDPGGNFLTSLLRRAEDERTLTNGTKVGQRDARPRPMVLSKAYA